MLGKNIQSRDDNDIEATLGINVIVADATEYENNNNILTRRKGKKRRASWLER